MLIIQRVSVEVRGELSTKPWLVRSTPHIWKEWINHTSITNFKTVKNKSIFTKGSNFFLQNVHAKKSFPDLLNSFEKKKNELKKLKFSI